MDQNPKDLILFECVISSSRSIRILAAAVQCLAKLGKEVSLEAEASTQSLRLRCVNDARTSFVVYEFRGEFFEEFSVADADITTAIIKLRSCLTVFRSTKNIDRLVISLALMDSCKHVVIFQAICRHSITKTYHFYYEDTEALDPQFDRELAKHRIRTRPKLLQEAMGRIHGTDEVEIVAMSGVHLNIASLHHQLDSNRTVKTSMRIPKDDFEEFAISEPKAKLIFSVREFRALITFCTTPGIDVSDVYLLFNDSGEPLMFTTASKYMESLMATATGMEEDLGQEERAAGHFSFSLVLSTITDDSGPDTTRPSQADASQS